MEGHKNCSGELETAMKETSEEGSSIINHEDEKDDFFSSITHPHVTATVQGTQLGEELAEGRLPVIKFSWNGP